MKAILRYDFIGIILIINIYLVLIILFTLWVCEILWVVFIKLSQLTIIENYKSAYNLFMVEFAVINDYFTLKNTSRHNYLHKYRAKQWRCNRTWWRTLLLVPSPAIATEIAARCYKAMFTIAQWPRRPLLLPRKQLQLDPADPNATYFFMHLYTRSIHFSHTHCIYSYETTTQQQLHGNGQ